ncbi:unnamed protein product [Cuscuta epithymum]|uniref:Reverse transcriptase zinc-binding domain-containing protein n=1 Tax=Cuscuta epithymum TaxID=186058 RepID=A0AAV0ETX1_9ASTE|nr:unnamed protein product [Cuscuta epithymum]
MEVAALRDPTGKKWNKDRINTIFNSEESMQICSLPISLQEKEDGYWWSKEKDGNFSVRSCYRDLMYENVAGNWDGWKDFWNLKIPPKIKYFIWQVLDGSIPSFTNLAKRGVPLQVVCKACLQEDESSDHALRRCSKAAEVWAATGIDTGMDIFGVEDWLKHLLSGTDAERKCRVWKRCNSLVWEGDWQQSAGLLNCCASILNAWRDAQQMGRGRSCSRQESGPGGWV